MFESLWYMGSFGRLLTVNWLINTNPIKFVGILIIMSTAGQFRKIVNLKVKISKSSNLSV